MRIGCLRTHRPKFRRHSSIRTLVSTIQVVPSTVKMATPPARKYSSIHAVHALQRCGNLFYDGTKFDFAVNETMPLLNMVHVDHNKITKHRLFQAVTTAARQPEAWRPHFDKLMAGCVAVKPLFTSNQWEHIYAWKAYDFTSINEILKREDESVNETPELIIRRLRIAETVLRQRTDRIALVLERCYDSHNEQAVLRTAECFGIQHIYMVLPVETKNRNLGDKITKGTQHFLTIKEFRTTKQCIEALRADGRDIWATDLSTEAVPLTFPNTSTSASPAPTTTASSSALDSSKSAILPTKSGDLIIPKKLAVVFGREADGCSQEILTAADKRIYFRLHGFTESLNLSVASGLVLQHLFFLCPEARGDLLTSAPTVAAEVRERWYKQLAKSPKKHLLYLQYLSDPPPPFNEEELRVAKAEMVSSSRIPKRIKKRLEATEQQIKEEEERAEKLGGQMKFDDPDDDEEMYEQDEEKSEPPAKKQKTAHSQ